MNRKRCCVECTTENIFQKVKRSHEREVMWKRNSLLFFTFHVNTSDQLLLFDQNFFFTVTQYHVLLITSSFSNLYFFLTVLIPPVLFQTCTFSNCFFATCYFPNCYLTKNIHFTAGSFTKLSFSSLFFR